MQVFLKVENLTGILSFVIFVCPIVLYPRGRNNNKGGVFKNENTNIGTDKKDGDFGAAQRAADCEGLHRSEERRVGKECRIGC